MFKRLLTIATVSAIATVAYAGSAQAAKFTYGSGAFRNDNVTNEGAFSENVNEKGYTTFDFNDGSLPGNDKVKYSYEGTSNRTKVTTNRWSPAGVNGEKNNSKYLQVFQGKNAVIETAKEGDVFNYFGINLGALSAGNTLQFFNAGNAVEFNYMDSSGAAKVATTLSYNILTALAPTTAQQHGGQTNGFFEFFSEGTTDNFDKIVISQVGGGGFETDNHTFRIGKGAHKDVPEPSIALGMLAVSGGMLLRKRKQQKSVQ
ncbi:MAG: PEP-CTERM sorting domain-containing protein [Cyanobacteria bacterium P01_A01_bin.84]